MAKKILLLDDEKDFLFIVKLNLEREGLFEVMALSDPDQIIPQMQLFKPDIIVLDMLMPKCNGDEVARRVRRDPEWGKIPIIILSALDTDKDKRLMKEAGVNDYLIKPIDISDLTAKIKKMLNIST